MIKKGLQFILPILLSLIIWELVSRSSWISNSLFPAPSQVAAALWSMLLSGTLLTDMGTSLWRLVVGLGTGVIIGIAGGLLTGRNKTLERMISPIIQILRPLPPVAIIPLVIVWFGIDNGAKIFSIAFAVFFPVWINTHIGTGHIPESYLWSARLLTRSWAKMFWKVMLPASLPFIFAGVRSAIALAFIMVFVSELAGASSGLGYRISITHLAYRIDEMIAALIVLGGLGALTDQLFVQATRQFFPWTKFSTK